MKKQEKGIALVVVIIMTILFAIVAAAVLLQAKANTEFAYREIRKAKAYYAAEAGLQRGVYEAGTGKADGTYSWSEFSVGRQYVPIQYTITTNGVDGSKTITSKISNLNAVYLYFDEP